MKAAFIQSLFEEIKRCGLKSRDDKAAALPNLIKSIYAEMKETGSVSDWQKVRLDDAIDYCRMGFVDISLECLKSLCEEPKQIPFWYIDKLKEQASVVDLDTAIKGLP